MALKILLLGAAAIAIWLMTRPRGGKSRGIETAMTRCDKCGVYHAPEESCDCK